MHGVTSQVRTQAVAPLVAGVVAAKWTLSSAVAPSACVAEVQRASGASTGGPPVVTAVIVQPSSVPVIAPELGIAASDPREERRGGAGSLHRDEETLTDELAHR